MARDSVIQIRVSQELKRQADELFEDMGLDTASAIRLFLKQSLIRESLPFTIERYAPSSKKKKNKKKNKNKSAQTSTEGIISQVNIEEPNPIINDLY